MEKIDVFDFDKTLYEKDSTIQFYLFSLKKNKKIIKYWPIQITYFILYKLKIVKKIVFKEKFFSFLKVISNVDEYIEEFWKQNKKYIRMKLLEKSKNKKYVISASPEFLLEDICKDLGIERTIASEVDKKNGKFFSPNCYGKEKVTRLRQLDKDIKIENFYTDSKSDNYLASIADNSFLIKNNQIGSFF